MRIRKKKVIVIDCANCGEPFEKDYYIYRQKVAWGQKKFYDKKCSRGVIARSII